MCRIDSAMVVVYRVFMFGVHQLLEGPSVRWRPSRGLECRMEYDVRGDKGLDGQEIVEWSLCSRI